MGMGRIKTVFAAVLSLILLSACQHLPSQTATSTPSSTRTAAENTTTGQANNTPPTPPSRATAATERGREEIVEVGTGRYIGEPKPGAGRVSKTGEGDITLNFQDTDLREFVKAILGDTLKENYVIDPKVAGKVTLETAKPIHKSELFPLFEKILAMNSTAVVQADGVYQILPAAQAAKGNLTPSTVEQPGRAGYKVRIIPLQYIAAEEMQKILEPFVSDGSKLRIDKKRNLVIVSGTDSEIDTVQRTVNIFDVDWLRGMSVGLYPLDYVDPKTLKEELDAVINGIQGDNGKDMLGGLVRVVPLERLNSILLIGSTASALREVEIWMHRLDKPGDKAGKRLYVYHVQNAKATELADILDDIFKTGGSSGQQLRPAELAPGLQPTQIANKQKAAAAGSSPATNNTPGTAGAGVAITSASSVKIIADDVHNALVVLASPQEYKMVESAITKLDIVPLQVLIEASIIEVTLDNNLNYGVEWYFSNAVGKDHKGIGTLDLGKAGLSALAPSFSYTIINKASDVRVALNALASESTVKVLSSPSLMVLDNKTATINIGDEIPVPTRQSVSSIDPNAPTVNEIQFRKTGVTLTVTPRVNSGGLVTMSIKQEVSNAVSTTSSNIDAPTIQQRQIESEVAINSGETIVLGGLIKDTSTNGNSGVPGLRRIPVLGSLFGQTNKEGHRTELLVLITPRVVGSKEQARDITDEFRQRLKGLTPPATPKNAAQGT